MTFITATAIMTIVWVAALAFYIIGMKSDASK